MNLKTWIGLIIALFLTTGAQGQKINNGSLSINFKDADQSKQMVLGEGVQQSSSGLIITASSQQFELKSERLLVPLEARGSFLGFGFSLEYENFSGEMIIQARTAKTEGEWDAWFVMEQIDLLAKEENRFRSELYFLEADVNYVQFKIALKKRNNDFVTLEKIDLFFTSPLEEPEASRKMVLAEAADKGSKAYTRPPYVNRQGWGCPQDENTTNRELTDVTHLIIHHSAGNTASNDFAGVVLAYWDYHVNGNGWDDIGYNWLIDRNGIIYKGRAWYDETQENIKGAHNSGKNSGTAGLCMIGSYIEDTVPSSEMWNATWEILAYLCDHYSLDPQGVSYHEAIESDNDVITGHRDSGGGTVCPGDIANSYEATRQAVADKIAGTYETGPMHLKAITDDYPGQDVEFTWNNSGTGWQLHVADDPSFDPYYVKWVSDLTSYTGPEGFVLAPGEAEPLGSFTSEQRYFWRMAYDGRITPTSSFTMHHSLVSMKHLTGEKELQLSVYPNPSRGRFSIKLAHAGQEGFTTNVYNSSGQLVYTANSVTQEAIVDLEGLPDGVYLMRVESTGEEALVKVVLYE